MPSKPRRWTVEITQRATRRLRRLDRAAASRVIEYLAQFEAPGADPRSKGSSLRGPMKALWRYRLGDYRILVSLEDETLVVLVVEVKHRSKAYR